MDPPPDPPDERQTTVRGEMSQLFRAEALEEYQRGRTDEGHPLEIEPRWMRRADLVILALLAAALLFGIVMALRGFGG